MDPRSSHVHQMRNFYRQQRLWRQNGRSLRNSRCLYDKLQGCPGTTRPHRALAQGPQRAAGLVERRCNLQFVLDSATKAMHDNERSGASQLSNVGPMLFQARVKPASLDHSISKWAKIDAWGDSVHLSNIDRFFWLKEKTKVWELQKQLREIRQGLIVLLGAGNV